MKLDLIMWTYNSSRHLAEVLERINEVIPKECINRRFIADDHSQDATKQIAEAYGWTVYMNRGKGLFDNIATAISLVETLFFASFEHDIVLSYNWWNKISGYMEDPQVAVAQGIRLSTNPTFRKIDEYIYHRLSSSGTVPPHSLDNNICRTEVIRQFGYEEGTTSPAMQKAGWKWIVDTTVVSDHIRESTLAAVLQTYKRHYLTHAPTVKQSLRILLTSPARAIHMTYKTKYPTLLFLYPVIRLAILFAALKKRMLK